MAVPTYEAMMLPLLQIIEKNGLINRSKAVELIAQKLNLTDEETTEMLPSGKFTKISDRVGWTRTYLRKAGLIDYPQRGLAIITERGKKVLLAKPEKIDNEYLCQFPEFKEFLESSQLQENSSQKENLSTETPDEILETVHLTLKNTVLAEMIEKIKSCSPYFFEKLVVDIVLKLGYGGSHKDAGRAIGKSGDEGIDGVINEDRLGLDSIYLQAKRWEGNVSRPEIQKFAGALQGKRARKGIFITTSDFTAEAKEYIKQIDSKIILISGKELAELMWEYNIGLSITQTYETKKLESDYFSE
jgi:restriction system protein